jgi:hypothetical protein
VQGRVEVHYAMTSFFALDDKTIVQASVDFKMKCPVLQTVRSAIVDEYHKFSKNLITIVPRKMHYMLSFKKMTNLDKTNAERDLLKFFFANIVIIYIQFNENFFHTGNKTCWTI